MMDETCLIRCNVRRGMFKDEYVVRFNVTDANGSPREAESVVYGDSVIFPANSKENWPEHGEVKGKLRGYCVKRTNNIAVVILPQPTMANGPSVFVPEAELV